MLDARIDEALKPGLQVNRGADIFVIDVSATMKSTLFNCIESFEYHRVGFTLIASKPSGHNDCLLARNLFHLLVQCSG
jgi:hypothetical protein